LPELVRDGETGFLVDSVDEAVEAVKRVGQIDPSVCRANVEARFSVRSMADGYEQAYRKAMFPFENTE
jgi:glycosyltransferase involved in cell wall biosynthesis